VTKPPFYIVTGGPGSGKTTVLAELARRGYICVPEDARAIIQEQIAGGGSGGSAVPWADAPRFANPLMQRSIRTYTTYHEQVGQYPQTPVYFDRGVGDAFTCADLIGHTLPANLCEQAIRCRYRDPAFLAQWWPEIYMTDEERRQTREQAEGTEHAIVRTYSEFGYRIVKLPQASPAERADFILRHARSC
jgi:predicted ATPase